MNRFQLLIGTTILAVAVWFGWWWVAAGAQKTALEAWLDTRRAQGWQAETASIDIAGFPNRLDATLTEVALADPARGWAWDAPRLSLHQIVYNPTEAIIVWPEEQRIAFPGARAALRSETMRASFAFSALDDLMLQRNSLEIVNGAIAADAGWTAGVARYNHHVRIAPDAGPENAYEFLVDAERLRLPEFLRRRVDPSGALPTAIDAVLAEGKAAFDHPLDRQTLESGRPAANALSLRKAEARWGELSLSLSGSVKRDASGYAEGAFDVSAKNWEAMLDAAVASGAMNRSLADAVRFGLGFVAKLSGDETTLDVALTFENGLTKIGPVPLGPAPWMGR